MCDLTRCPLLAKSDAAPVLGDAKSRLCDVASTEFDSATLSLLVVVGTSPESGKYKLDRVSKRVLTEHIHSLASSDNRDEVRRTNS
jgi:hypothetical protein